MHMGIIMMKINSHICVNTAYGMIWAGIGQLMGAACNIYTCLNSVDHQEES